MFLNHLDRSLDELFLSLAMTLMGVLLALTVFCALYSLYVGEWGVALLVFASGYMPGSLFLTFRRTLRRYFTKGK